MRRGWGREGAGRGGEIGAGGGGGGAGTYRAVGGGLHIDLISISRLPTSASCDAVTG